MTASRDFVVTTKKTTEVISLINSHSANSFVIGPSCPIFINSSMREYTPVSGFSIDEDYLCANELTTEFHLLQACVRFLKENDQPFSKSDYGLANGVTIDYFPIPEVIVDSVHNGRSDFLCMRGTAEQLNIALAGLSVNFHGDRDLACRLEVIVDTRWLDGTKTLQKNPKNVSESISRLTEYQRYKDLTSGDGAAVSVWSVAIQIFSEK